MQGVSVSGSEQLVQCHEGTDHRQASHDQRVERARGGETRSAFSLRRMCAWGVMAGVGSLLTFSVSPAAAKPCAEHVGAAKKACAKQLKRDAMPYPPRPTWSEAMKRLTPYEQTTILRIGRCEMGEQHNDVKAWGKHGPASGPWARLRWGLSLPRYSTAFGIWNGNGAYIRQETGGYAFPGRTPAEEVLGVIALAKGPARGFSGWGCF